MDLLSKHIASLARRTAPQHFDQYSRQRYMVDARTAKKRANVVRRHFRGCTYCYGVKELGESALEKVKNLYKLEDDDEERRRLIKGMSCSEAVPELKRICLP
ncbi:hypothetical protein ANCCAN_04640 [Ancylostoma caninum]|uniref:Uncharacterized protein n=1 Tax=Ancylostoma caninum TaxID=29170 RepID=A0A368H1S1_ANCCA|nr:hypothetical protein ANCCAN_04640 [Ancylostoma caninum]